MFMAINEVNISKEIIFLIIKRIKNEKDMSKDK